MPEKYTIMIVPKTASKMRKFQVSKSVIHLSLCILALFFITGGVFIYRYIDYRAQARELPALRTGYNQQKVQLQTLVLNIDNLKKDINRLEKFSRKFRTIVGLPQVEENLQQVSGMGGGIEDSFLEFTQRREDEYMSRLHKELFELSREVEKEQDNMQELSEEIEEKTSLLACTPSIWPTKGWLTSGYGYRNSPFTGQREMHKGIDIATRFNNPVRSPADGVVTFAGRKGSLGNVVVVEHGYGYSTRFGHNSRIVVKAGDRIKRNQIIAYVGSTGRTTGPHLHYEVRIDGVAVNPFNYLLD
jgi:murein DD-endopeptidase MepM/ murein hydrolase activator NlpD